MTWRAVGVESISANLAPQSPLGERPWESGFGYQPSATLTVPRIRSGVYLVDGRLPLIIKTPATDRPDVVVVCPTNTEAAYNGSGGRSMYTKAPDTAAIVSFRRPVERPMPGSDADVFMTWMQPQKLPYTFKYCADSDLDDYGEIAGARLLVIIGHSEYWTRRARENFDRFVLEGGNALVLSGNTMWWQVRYSDDRSQMICYKWQPDPNADPSLRCINWPDPKLGYPVVSSLGADFPRGGYADDPRDAGWDGFKILLPDSPVFRGVAVQRGDVIRMRSHEYDGAPLLNNPVTLGEPRLDLAAMGAYRAEIIGYDYVAVWAAATRGDLDRDAADGEFGHDHQRRIDRLVRRSGLGGADGAKLRTIILNMIAVLRNRERLFVT